MENKILVMYIGVAGIRSIDIEDTIHKISKKITPSTFEGEIIIIPTQSLDTKIECINPVYITDEKLISEHTDMMKKLQIELDYQLKNLKENKLLNNGK
jgi:hypothetical protein